MMLNRVQQASITNIPAPIEPVAKPLSELTAEQKTKITVELAKIHALVSRVADDDLRQYNGKDKADKLK